MRLIVSNCHNVKPFLFSPLTVLQQSDFRLKQTRLSHLLERRRKRRRKENRNAVVGREFVGGGKMGQKK